MSRIAKTHIHRENTCSRAKIHSIPTCCVLCTLIHEKSVSRAAIRLNQSQPAISAALRRLRAIFNDPLLVRDKNRMVPTARALQAVEQARRAGLIDGLSISRRVRSRCHAAALYYCSARLPGAALHGARRPAHAFQGARGAACHTSAGAELDYEQALQNAEVDIVIGNWPSLPEHLHISTLIEDEVVCLMDASHPLAAPEQLTVERYLQAAHVVFTPYSPDQRGVVESSLGTMRVSRGHCVMHLLLAGPDLLVGTDLLLTTSRHFAVYYVAPAFWPYCRCRWATAPCA